VARALDEWAAGDPVQVQGLQSGTGTDDIGDGILCPDLVEANAFRRNAMDGSFRHGDPLENRESTLFDPGSQGACLEQLTDLVMVPAMGVIVGMGMVVSMLSMMMVAVIMVVMSGRLPIDSIVSLDPEAPSCDSTSISPLEAAPGELDRKGGKDILKDVLRHTEIPQGSHGHVAADSGKGIDMEDSHGTK
jgi:hypothetical protein